MADPRVAAIPVRECGEPLVDTADSEHLRVDDRMADEHGQWRLLRAGVVERLERAAQLLPPGVRLLVLEGYRSPQRQERGFTRYRETLRALRPDLDEGALRAAASRYISPPEVAPHPSGAAIDLTLCDDDGTELDLGCAYDATPEESDGGCFTAAPGLPERAAANRRLLVEVLTEAGLVNYPTEWWHWSYGDRYWALKTGAPAALYGPHDLTAPAQAAAV
ncbi:D-alanyl-D-alanine dipeptidase [Quadrisphaera granulorum]|uniref:D-alanyl-D-alanine dipeptidase n=2 Tax=Quadrisphaera granulorum TaxID=317664 RepID=A0A315ZU13_9ACTN|nr:D-alanyl-D-alanine dipeptidase [Quadrisphaera granulorum]SZE98291.1 D-alanyl-D-alanine dipeptidase [Quadrisphaera granulorum]